MAGTTSIWEKLTAEQAHAAELVTNRVFAVVMAVIVMVLLLKWLRTVHEERIAYANAYSNAKVKRAVEQTEQELDSWRGVDLDQKVRIRVLEAENEELKRKNAAMADLMARVKAGDLNAR